jgi:hypothetical protein
LDHDYRKDLALVCESHNLDDLDDTKKYHFSKPYGNSDAETVNLQYCSIILRTVDLIQITKRRAPTILFRLINPADPISQGEWAKQNAVKRIRAQVATDREGNADPALPSYTIEVFALFLDGNAYFGLNAYLRYAALELTRSYNIINNSKKLTPKQYTFPWSYIDSTNVQVEGFMKQQFSFQIDQDKILDLLTGHTLYNDSNVVVRELLQNAIDAVRLQFSDPGLSSEKEGRIRIVWNSLLSELTITDNGTGMSQHVIENHLLKVGSSRYQDPKFRERYPFFSPISRFGIGVLSAFMVADEVEICVGFTGNQGRRTRLALRRDWRARLETLYRDGGYATQNPCPTPSTKNRSFSPASDAFAGRSRRSSGRWTARRAAKRSCI